MAAPYAREEPVVLRPEGRREWPYVALTARVMRDFGLPVEQRRDGRWEVPRGVYRARGYDVEPDASGASYFFAAAALVGGRVRVPGLGRGSVQGDMRFLEVLEEMGCDVEVGEDRAEVRGTGELRGVQVEMGDFSDTMMTLAVLAPFAGGPTAISGVAHTRLQETDRVSAVAAELRRLGVKVEERPDGLTIHPGPVRPTAPVETYGDHRMAMAFALVGLVVPGLRIKDPGCVTKTLPGYFELLDSLRGPRA
jgi:3-phosphoshikimate 1-carboxyvinyltransferase